MLRHGSRKLALTLAYAVVSTSLLAQEAPKPGPEFEVLGYYVGTWEFVGEAKEGPTGPGGPVTLTETCDLFGEGFAIVCRSEGTTPMGPSKAIGIMSYDTAKKAYTYYAADGNMPAFSATGRREGKTWHWLSEMPMGSETMRVRVTSTETSATSYTFKLESSSDGMSWTTMMEGTYTKT